MAASEFTVRTARKIERVDITDAVRKASEGLGAKEGALLVSVPHTTAAVVVGEAWDPAVTGDPGHVPARPAVAVDGKERKLAKAGGKKKVHLLAAITHGTGLVIGQDKVAKAGKANHFDYLCIHPYETLEGIKNAAEIAASIFPAG